MNAEERTRVLQRLEILDALVAALDRRQEVFDVIVASPSAEHARASIAGLLGITDIGAMAILDLQWRRFAELERGRIVDERDAIRAELGM